MKKSSKAWLFYLVTLVFLGGNMASCATVGKTFPEEAVRDIRIGMTTQKDLRAVFGEPWRTGLEDGLETWTYGRYRYRLFKDSESSDLVIRFDNKGVVTSYSYSTTNPVAGK